MRRASSTLTSNESAEIGDAVGLLVEDVAVGRAHADIATTTQHSTAAHLASADKALWIADTRVTLRRAWSSPGFTKTFLSGSGTLGVKGSRLGAILSDVPDSFVLVE
jgi:hypothetical protein